MDYNANDSQVLERECTGVHGSVLVEHHLWRVYEMVFTPEKLDWLWESMIQYRTLFSDLTRGSRENFVNLVALPNSFWMEVVEIDSGRSVGIIYIMNMHQVVDYEVHVIFFDRKLAPKVELCKAVMRWIFEEFPPMRLSAEIPAIYHATVRLAKNVGFKHEGTKRKAQLFGGKWIDSVLLGILREEVL